MNLFVSFVGFVCIQIVFILLDLFTIGNRIDSFITIGEMVIKVKEPIFYTIYRPLRLSVAHFLCIFYQVEKLKSEPNETTKRVWENRQQRTGSILKMGIGLWIWVMVICIDVWSVISDNTGWALYHLLRFGIEHLIIFASPGLIFVGLLRTAENLEKNNAISSFGIG